MIESRKKSNIHSEYGKNPNPSTLDQVYRLNVYAFFTFLRDRRRRCCCMRKNCDFASEIDLLIQLDVIILYTRTYISVFLYVCGFLFRQISRSTATNQRRSVGVIVVMFFILTVCACTKIYYDYDDDC